MPLYPGVPYEYTATANGLVFTAGACPLDDEGRVRRPDAIDQETGERLGDVLMFRVARREGPPAQRRPWRVLHDAALRRLPRGPDADSGPGAGRPGRAAGDGRRGVADAGEETRCQGVARRARSHRRLKASARIEDVNRPI